MVTEHGKPVKANTTNQKKGLKSHKKEFGPTEAEFENLVLENIPGWTAVWNMLLRDGKELRKKHNGKAKPTDLEKRIRKKISELVAEEETLVNLYRKAAAVAKKKEEEFKGKTVSLLRQIEKDKNLLKTLRVFN